MTQKNLYIVALSIALIADASAQQYVYPAKGQTPQKQENDESACYSWAVQQTGFDPAKPTPSQPVAAATSRRRAYDINWNDAGGWRAWCC